jgi:hypothetical protein
VVRFETSDHLGADLAFQLGGGGFRRGQEVGGVAVPDGVRLAGGEQLGVGEVVDGLEQPVPLAVEADE